METKSNLTKEQKELRIGKFNCSSIHKLMGAKGLGKTGETYVYEVASEFLTGQRCIAEFSSAATAWGNDLELEAQLYFEAATGLKVVSCETTDNGFISGTPDGKVVDENSGFEIKCPYSSANHLKNLGMTNAADLLDLRPEYYWQITGYFWIFGFTKYRFCSYDPRYKKPEHKMLILNLELVPEHLELLKNRVTEAKKLYDSIINNLT